MKNRFFTLEKTIFQGYNTSSYEPMSIENTQLKRFIADQALDILTLHSERSGLNEYVSLVL